MLRKNYTTFEIALIDDDDQMYSSVPALERPIRDLFHVGYKTFDVHSVQSIREMSVQELSVYMEFLAEMQCPFELNIDTKERLMASFYLDKGEREDTFKRFAYSIEEDKVIKKFLELIKLCKDYWQHREEVRTFNDKFVEHTILVLISIWTDKEGAL